MNCDPWKELVATLASQATLGEFVLEAIHTRLRDRLMPHPCTTLRKVPHAAHAALDTAHQAQPPMARHGLCAKPTAPPARQTPAQRSRVVDQKFWPRAAPPDADFHMSLEFATLVTVLPEQQVALRRAIPILPLQPHRFQQIVQALAQHLNMWQWSRSPRPVPKDQLRKQSVGQDSLANTQIFSEFSYLMLIK